MPRFAGCALRPLLRGLCAFKSTSQVILPVHNPLRNDSRASAIRKSFRKEENRILRGRDGLSGST